MLLKRRGGGALFPPSPQKNLPGRGVNTKDRDRPLTSFFAGPFLRLSTSPLILPLTSPLREETPTKKGLLEQGLVLNAQKLHINSGCLYLLRKNLQNKIRHQTNHCEQKDMLLYFSVLYLFI